MDGGNHAGNELGRLSIGIHPLQVHGRVPCFQPCVIRVWDEPGIDSQKHSDPRPPGPVQVPIATRVHGAHGGGGFERDLAEEDQRGRHGGLVDGYILWAHIPVGTGCHKGAGAGVDQPDSQALAGNVFHRALWVHDRLDKDARVERTLSSTLEVPCQRTSCDKNRGIERKRKRLEEGDQETQAEKPSVPLVHALSVSHAVITPRKVVDQVGHDPRSIIHVVLGCGKRMGRGDDGCGKVRVACNERVGRRIPSCHRPFPGRIVDSLPCLAVWARIQTLRLAVPVEEKRSE